MADNPDPVLRRRDPPHLLSIVIPIYNEEDVVPILSTRLQAVIAELPYAVECILVDDGSSDQTLQLLTAWSQTSNQIKIVELSRNFGHQIATTAGLDLARGDAVVILDADLQDPPELIPQMVDHYCEGYDVVYGQRSERQGESAFKRLTANVFYTIMRHFIAKNLPADTGDFRLMSRRVTDDLKRIKERERFLRGLVSWIGYRQKAISYVRPPRVAGKTKFPIMKMVRFAVNAIVSFSDLPLCMIIWVGVFSILVSLALILKILFQYYFTDIDFVRGWASIGIMICFFSGTILLSLGMIGLYVGRIYTEVQQRPLYLVAQKLNFGEDDEASTSAD